MKNNLYSNHTPWILMAEQASVKRSLALFPFFVLLCFHNSLLFKSQAVDELLENVFKGKLGKRTHAFYM